MVKFTGQSLCYGETPPSPENRWRHPAAKTEPHSEVARDLGQAWLDSLETDFIPSCILTPFLRSLCEWLQVLHVSSLRGIQLNRRGAPGMRIAGGRVWQAQAVPALWTRSARG